MAHLLAVAAIAVTGAFDPDPVQVNDWLVTSVVKQPTLTNGTFGGIPSLELTNGLITRTFVLPPPPQEAKGNGSCMNPGGRRIQEPDGSTYPYYGSTCSQDSDCGQCILDGTCKCNTSDAAAIHCCVPLVAPATAPGFATAFLGRQGYAGRELRADGAQLLRATSPEAVVTLDGVEYNVGGLDGQTEFSFLNTSLLRNFTPAAGAFVFRPPYRLNTSTQKRYEWTPGARHSDASAQWPPLGLSLELDFVAPDDAPAAHQDVTITVVYEMYTGIPVLSKWVRIASNGTTAVTVDALTTEYLFPNEEAMSYWATQKAGQSTGGTTTGRIHMSSEMSRGGDTTVLQSDARCGTCVQGNGLQVLNSSYPVGPGTQIGASGFHGSVWESFHTYLLVHDTDDIERQGLGIRKMYRTLSPQVTENPIFMHLTDASPAGIRSAVDQCNASGFEMIILSFGTALNMESKDEAYIKSVAESVEYAHSKGIEIGGYNLMSSSRTVAPGGGCCCFTCGTVKRCMVLCP